MLYAKFQKDSLTKTEALYKWDLQYMSLKQILVQTHESNFNPSMDK